MQTVKEVLSNLPKRIKGYDLITENKMSIGTDKNSFIEFYNSITKGFVEEVLISYDNHWFRYSMRVKERGENMYIELEYMEILQDHVGPYSAQTIERKKIHNWDLETTVDYFLKWVEEHIK